jgi:hypothetical protein
LSGPRNPYPGKLGVVEEGALADLLLVDGNPIENIGLIEDPATNFLVIMKDRKIYYTRMRSPAKVLGASILAMSQQRRCVASRERPFHV